MKHIVVDIETAPLKIEHEDIKDYLMDKKISKEKRSLDPNYSKIIAIGIKLPDEPVKILAGNNEKEMLADFWDILKNNKTDVIVTHNGYQFDIPFLILRSVINNIEIPININTNRWAMENSNHFDTMMFFSNYGNFTNLNLNILCKMHGIEVSKGRISGADIEKLYLDGEWEKIKNHCREDTELLDKLFSKLCFDYLKKKKFK